MNWVPKFDVWINRRPCTNPNRYWVQDMKSSTFELGLRDALQNKTKMARICLYTARSISFFSWVSRGARATRAASAIARVINFFLARCKWRAKNKERLPRIYFVSDSLRLSHDLECTSHDHLFLEYWPLKSLPTADCPSEPTKNTRLGRVRFRKDFWDCY